MIIILDREEPDPRAVQRGANNKNMNMKQEGPFLGLGRRIMTTIIIVIISNYHTMIMNMIMNRGDLIIIIIM